MKIWQLRKGAERKIRSGHPWIFSNDLAASPKGTEAGELIELQDAQGAFLARGYGHPNSLIAFRRITLDPQDVNFLGVEALTRAFNRAALLRAQVGLAAFSHRLCFAEADGLPGLIVDRYKLSAGQVLVVQTSTAGMDRALPQILLALEEFCSSQPEGPGLAATAIVVSNNSQSRVLENLAVEPRRVHRPLADIDLNSVEILVRSADGQSLIFTTDLLNGQKTGFFLDQHFNVTTTTRLVQQMPKAQMRVLDLCCYVGQWSTHLASALSEQKRPGEFTLVDSSQAALQLAQTNVTRHGGLAKPTKLDVLEGLNQLPERHYDVVICDPPAFIKRKKDLGSGTAAYVKMNRDALKRTAAGGLYIACSCSGLLSEGEFQHALRTAVIKSGRSVRWILRGSQSPDHPVRMEFPEGQYLKCHIGIVDN